MKRIISILIAISSIAAVFGQAPASFKYQAVARNAAGQIITNTQVNFQIAILKSSLSGSSVYTETFAPTTNNFGIVNLNIGTGTVVSGTFGTIDWGTDTYFIKVWLNGTEMGTSQLLSVPYALYAKKAETVASITITGSENAFSEWDKDASDDFNGHYNSLIEKPTTISGYGIIDAISNTHPSNGITSTNITNWDTAYNWGDHAVAGYQSLIVTGSTNQYWRGDKTWRTLDKTAIGLSNVENTALSTWIGSNKINTLGTIATGTWNAGSVTSSGTITGKTIKKLNGTSSQFLKADGSVDSSSYLTSVREINDEYTAIAAQTIFTLTQTPSPSSKIKMYINGVRISNTAYSITSATLTYVPVYNGSYSLVAGDRIQFDYYY